MKKVIELIIGLLIGLVIGYTAGNAPGAQDLPAEAVAVAEALQAPEGSEAWASVTEARTREALAPASGACELSVPLPKRGYYAGDSVPMLKILTLNSTTV